MIIVRVPNRVGRVSDIDPNDPLPPLCGIASCEGERPATRVRCDLHPQDKKPMLFYACRFHAFALEDEVWLRNVEFVKDTEAK